MDNINIIAFIKKPTVILRLTSIVFSIIIFGSIISEGWKYDGQEDQEVCIINQSYSTCQLATSVGVLAFIIALVILTGEYFYEQVESGLHRKQFVLADLTFSGVFSLLFLITFSALANQWSKSPEPAGHYGVANVGAAISFSFFSIFIWTVSSVLAYRKYQVGAETEFSSQLLPGDSVFGETGGSGYQSIGGYNQEASSSESPQYRSRDTGEDLKY